MSPRTLSAAGAAGAIILGFGTAATAGIVCNKGFQQIQGSWLSTPYCEDAYVADVAREYGFKASAAEVRANPLYKQRLCRFIGADIRIKETCEEVNPAGRGRF